MLRGSVPSEAAIYRRDYTLGRLVPDSCNIHFPDLFPPYRNRPDQSFFTRTHTSTALVLGVFCAVRPGLGSIDAPHRGLRTDKCAGDRLDQHREPLDDGRAVGNDKEGTTLKPEGGFTD